MHEKYEDEEGKERNWKELQVGPQPTSEKRKGKEIIGDMTVQEYQHTMLENEELKHKCQMYEAKIKRLESVIQTLRMEIDDIRHGKGNISETSTLFQKESFPKNMPQGELIDVYRLIFFTFFSMF